MKRLYRIVLACLLLSVRVCGQTAEEYNEQVTNSTDSLHLMAIMWVHACQDINGSDPDYHSLAAPRKVMERFIKQQISRFKTEPEIEGADDMRKALLALYEFEQELVKEAFIPYEKLKSSASADEVARCKENFMSRLKQEQAVLENLNKARKEFAKKNKIEIAKKPDAPKPAFLRTPPKHKPKTETAETGDEQVSPQRPPQEPAPTRARDEQRRAPQTPPQARPTSSGNPNNKMPSKEEPKPKPKDEDEGEDGE